MILIDISDSMKGSGLEQIKEAVSRILDGKSCSVFGYFGPESHKH